MGYSSQENDGYVLQENQRVGVWRACDWGVGTGLYRNVLFLFNLAAIVLVTERLSVAIAVGPGCACVAEPRARRGGDAKMMSKGYNSGGGRRVGFGPFCGVWSGGGVTGWCVAVVLVERTK